MAQNGQDSEEITLKMKDFQSYQAELLKLRNEKYELESLTKRQENGHFFIL